MIRAVRLLLYFAAGCLLSIVSIFSYAETIPATQSTTDYLWANSTYCGVTGLPCQTAIGLSWAVTNKASADYVARQTDLTCITYNTEPATTTGQQGCTAVSANQIVSQVKAGTAYRGSALLVCPPGQNWTLSGSICTRPDCVSPETRDEATGLCKPPEIECNYPAGNQTPNEAGTACECNVGLLNIKIPGERPWFSGVGEMPTIICDGGCYRGTGFGLGGGDFWQMQGGLFSGATCTEPKPNSGKPVAEKKPPCAPSEGVMTSSTGNVMCVPEGTADERKPVVEKKKKTETFPDQTTKTTETVTTTDPATNAKDTHTTTTSSGGASGAAGTTTSEESESGTGGEGDGDCSSSEECGEGGGGNFPENGDLWEKKYPEGLTGVLNAKYAEIKNTQLFSLVNQLVPTSLPGGGSCPQYSFSMNMGSGMNFGSSSIEMPCIVWDFVRIVMLIGASLLARRLIFGG